MNVPQPVQSNACKLETFLNQDRNPSFQRMMEFITSAVR